MVVCEFGVKDATVAVTVILWPLIVTALVARGPGNSVTCALDEPETLKAGE